MISVKNLETPDDTPKSDHGCMEVVNLPGATIVRATFEPGWRWSTDIKPVVGTSSCQVAHIGVVLSGRFAVRTDSGELRELGPLDAHVLAPGHDAWVVGEEPCVVLDVTPTGSATGGHVGRCPCGVEFRVATNDQRDHLVAAIQEHAAGSHGHAVSREDVLSTVATT